MIKKAKKAIETHHYYQKCNLQGNPFLTNPIFASDPRAKIWAGDKKQKEQLEKYFQRSLADNLGNINFLMLYGDYGAGKTHALFWAKNKILFDKKHVFNSVCYMIPSLRGKRGKFSFADAFSRDIVESGLLDDVEEFRKFLQDCIAVCSGSKGSNRNQQLENLHDEQIIKKLIPEKELYDFAILIWKKKNPDELATWLNPPRLKLTDYEAMIHFTRVMNLFVYEIKISETDRRRFKKGAYLFMDEMEDLRRMSIAEAREINDTLRHIYDNCPRCFCMVVAFTAETMLLPSMFAQYVLARVQDLIELPHLDASDAKTFVKDILRSNRVDSKGRSAFFPFEEEAVDGVVSRFIEITPRGIVDAMQRMLEEARLANHNPDEELISLEFLDEHGILDEVLKKVLSLSNVLDA